MPEYSYSCDPQLGGCGYFFTVFQKLSKYRQLKKCPECKKHKLVRDYAEDSVYTATSSDGATIGHLADKNSARMSNDEKAALTKKHNKYREDKGSLPIKGKRMKKSDKKPWYRSKDYKGIQKMTETQQKNYIRTGKKNG